MIEPEPVDSQGCIYFNNQEGEQMASNEEQAFQDGHNQVEESSQKELMGRMEAQLKELNDLFQKARGTLVHNQERPAREQAYEFQQTHYREHEPVPMNPYQGVPYSRSEKQVYTQASPYYRTAGYGDPSHRSDFHEDPCRLYNRRAWGSETSVRSGIQMPIKIPTFTGKEDWQVWLARFETLASRYGWGEEEKLDRMLPCLEGKAAQFVFTQLPPWIRHNYRELSEELCSRFRIIETTRSFASQFSRRQQRHGETLEEYAAELKSLYDRGHGFRDRRTREEDLLRRFLDGLQDESLRCDIEFAKEPTSIDEAVYHAVNLGLIRNTCKRNGFKGRYETRRTFGNQPEEISQAAESGPERKEGANSYVKELEKRLNKLEEVLEKRKRPYQVTCFKCQQKGHISRNCQAARDGGSKDRRRNEAEALNLNGLPSAARGMSNQ